MKRFAVIGDPIKHSMSPYMHNDLFQHYQIDARYDRVHIEKGMLETGLELLKKDGLAGFNVTVPHKTDILPFLDELDPLCKEIGAVNTVVNEKEKWIGYNTDGAGYLAGILKVMPELKDKKTLMIGAGGAARAIYFTLAHHGVETIDIVNRTKVRAEQLKAACPYPVQTAILSAEAAEQQLGEYDLIIQTTSIGMSPEIDDSPLDVTNIKENALISDIIYNPLEPKILQEGKSRGAIVQNGIEMFVYQGALAFEKWLGLMPDTDRMRKNVRKQLGGN